MPAIKYIYKLKDKKNYFLIKFTLQKSQFSKIINSSIINGYKFTCNIFNV